ncbi:Leucine-rich repeat-containing protein 49 [Terramyces sp. JEL0728]|nr:Leucine-rich repeat-containing protein 49 [Terramyces sp. JEL0728]
MLKEYIKKPTYTEEINPRPTSALLKLQRTRELLETNARSISATSKNLYTISRSILNKHKSEIVGNVFIDTKGITRPASSRRKAPTGLAAWPSKPTMKSIEPIQEKLDLNNRNLQTFPKLRDQEALKLLDLQNNLLSKIENLDNLSNLVFLDLYNNYIEKISGMEGLFSLRVLMLGRNKIQCLEGLEFLNKLDILDLHSNRIEKIGISPFNPENFGNLFNLRVLNLEDNLVQEIPTLTGLYSLCEMNIKKNKHLKKLSKMLLSDNKIAALHDLESMFAIPNLAEVSMDQNPIAENSNFKTLIVSKMPNLKLLDGKRILDETKRNAIRLLKKEENRKRDLEKRNDFMMEREKFISQIKENWANGKFNESNVTLIDSETTFGKSAYVELDGTCLHIYGNGIAAITRHESQNISALHFDFIDASIITPCIPIILKLKNLTSIEFGTCKINQLSQIKQLKLLPNLQNLTISENNTVVKMSVYRLFTIYILGNLVQLDGALINQIEKRNAFDKFKILGFLQDNLMVEQCVKTKQGGCDLI